MRVRRVVSGQNSAGAAVIVSDEMLEPAGGGATSGIHLWGADSAPRFPADGAMPAIATVFPALAGYRFAMMRIAPDAQAHETAAGDRGDPEMRKQFEELLEDGAPGMHTTDTIDFEVVVSGEAGIELDDGAKIYLKPGDCFVQNGTRGRGGGHDRRPPTVMNSASITPALAREERT